MSHDEEVGVMRRKPQPRLGAAAIIASSTLIGLPASAIDWQSVEAMCEGFLYEHLEDLDWEAACVSVMEDWKSQQISAPPMVEIPSRVPSGKFPIVQTASVPGQHDGDRHRIREVLRAGQGADILVEFEASALRDEIHARAAEEGLRHLDADHLEEKRAGYASIKRAELEGLQGVTILREYENLPTTFVHVTSEAAFDGLIARSQVKAVFENKRYEPFVAESLPLIGQPQVAEDGFRGAGTTVAVLDTGVDYTAAPFNCSAPGTQGCRVVDTFEAAPDDGVLDSSGHGTRVSAIAALTASETDVIVADVHHSTEGAKAADAKKPSTGRSAYSQTSTLWR